ncbi:hypothetical protein B0T25DRAFT_343445 [Lasiosphaeria hispida]|uniref:Secreted protein n=1 Tax=Lasiosphaeria hispida TaxID=260671 RepID=A0AAJ0H6J1_9PEZI|nr:hypothetical protein B0T25DRAFT_343445 [Lasiosphaeria hispida]
MLCRFLLITVCCTRTHGRHEGVRKAIPESFERGMALGGRQEGESVDAEILSLQWCTSRSIRPSSHQPCHLVRDIEARGLGPPRIPFPCRYAVAVRRLDRTVSRTPNKTAGRNPRMAAARHDDKSPCSRGKIALQSCYNRLAVWLAHTSSTNSVSVDVRDLAFDEDV